MIELRTDPAAIVQALDMLLKHGRVAEIRALNVQDGNRAELFHGQEGGVDGADSSAG